MDVGIAAVNLASSFPLVSYRSGGSNYDCNEWKRAELTSTTNLRVSARCGGPNNELQWQVVEFTGASVQSGNVAFLAGDPSKTISPLPTAVDLSKSWLLYTYETDGTRPQIGRGLVRGRITDSTTLVFDRDATGGAASMDLTWYLVEFTYGTTVRSGNMNFPNGTGGPLNATLSPAVSPAWSIAGEEPGRGGASRRLSRTTFPVSPGSPRTSTVPPSYSSSEPSPAPPRT